MGHKTIKINKDTIIGVIGDIHEHERQFDSIVDRFKPDQNKILVSLGDIYDKGFGTKTAESIIRKIKKLHEKSFSHIVLGNHDYKRIRKARIDGKIFNPELEWLNKQPLSISFKYPNGKSVLVLHGGVTPNHKLEDLYNSEILYVRMVDENGKHISFKRVEKDGNVIFEPSKDGVIWHKKYDGRFGYICSGHDAQDDGIPKYHKYSCNIDTAVYKTGILTCQTFNQKGLGEKIQAYDTPYSEYKNKNEITL